MQIAVCDDEKEIRDMFAEKIGKLYPEAELSLYRSGEELLLSDKAPDILLLDIQMPGKSGMEAAKELRRKRQKPSLMITTGGEHIAVNLEDIIYAEVFDRKVILHTMDADIEYYGKMKELEEKAGDEFYRTHRSYLVNFGLIRKYDATTVYLKRGQALISKQNYG